MGSTFNVYGERNMSQRTRKGQGCLVELEHLKIKLYLEQEQKVLIEYQLVQ